MRFTCTLVAVFVGLAGGAVFAQDVTAPGDFIIPIDLDGGSTSPAAEQAPNAIDNNTATKYLNNAPTEENSGFIVTPTLGSLQYGTVITGFNIITANDAVERDPTTFSIWGTNQTIVSGAHSTGGLETWTPITIGTAITLPAARFTAGTQVNFSNSLAFKSYRVVFPTVKDTPESCCMQLAEAQLIGTALSSLNTVQNIQAIPPATGPGAITGQTATAGSPDTLNVDLSLTGSGTAVSFLVRVVGVSGPESVRVEVDATNNSGGAIPINEFIMQATGTTITNASSPDFLDSFAGDTATFTDFSLANGDTSLLSIDLSIPGANGTDPVTGLPSYSFILNLTPLATPEPQSIAMWSLIGFVGLGAAFWWVRKKR